MQRTGVHHLGLATLDIDPHRRVLHHQARLDGCVVRHPGAKRGRQDQTRLPEYRRRQHGRLYVSGESAGDSHRVGDRHQQRAGATGCVLTTSRFIATMCRRSKQSAMNSSAAASRSRQLSITNGGRSIYFLLPRSQRLVARIPVRRSRVQRCRQRDEASPISRARWSTIPPTRKSFQDADGSAARQGQQPDSGISELVISAMRI